MWKQIIRKWCTDLYFQFISQSFGLFWGHRWEFVLLKLAINHISMHICLPCSAPSIHEILQRSHQTRAQSSSLRFITSESAFAQIYEGLLPMYSWVERGEIVRLTRRALVPVQISPGESERPQITIVRARWYLHITEVPVWASVFDNGALWLISRDEYRDSPGVKNKQGGFFKGKWFHFNPPNFP